MAVEGILRLRGLMLPTRWAIEQAHLQELTRLEVWIYFAHSMSCVGLNRGKV